MLRSRARRKAVVGLALLLVLVVLTVGFVDGADHDRRRKFGRRKRDAKSEDGEVQAQQENPVVGKEETFETPATWSSCNVTGPCLRCSKEEMVKDHTSCGKTRHRVEITCLDSDEAETGDRPRETFVMYESCKVNEPLAIGYFMGIMVMILAFTSPVVVIRRRLHR